MTTYLSIPKWEEYQHYKDRNPPWIKLHNKLLESYDFECLPDASKAHLICIWLLASRTNNKMKADKNWIQRKIGANSEVDINALVNSGFLVIKQEDGDCTQNASMMLQEPASNSCTEKRESREEKSREEPEKKKDTSKAAPVDFSIFGMTDEQLSEMKRIRKKNKGGAITQRVADALSKEFHAAAQFGFSFDELLTEWELRGWKSLKAEWIKPKASDQQSQAHNDGLSAITRKNLQNTMGDW